MPCFHPLKAYRHPLYKFQFSNNSGLSFDPAAKKIPGVMELSVPCGQCFGCRLERSKNWALRILLEQKLHKESCFITLTYDDEHLPSSGSLNPDDVTKFLKRLRKHFSGKRLRYFYCGEYGDRYARPHYHLCLFGEEFLSDRKYFSGSYGNTLYTSATLEKLWSKGYCPFGSLTYDSAAYTARYILKKITGDPAVEHYQGRTPEFVRMSRCPGIGNDWFQLYGKDLYNNDFITIKNGLKARTPKYFDKLFKASHCDFFHDVVVPRRLEKAQVLSSIYTDERLSVMESVAKEKLKFLKRRKFECGLK